MSKKPKIKDRTPIPTPTTKAKISFSFEYYDTSYRYCFSLWSAEQLKQMLARLKEINAKTFEDMRASRSTLHFHEVDWSATIEKSGFPTTVPASWSAFQFSLLNVNGQKTRVYGAFFNNVFYVVWFDLEHVIWPSYKKHT